MVTMGTPMSDKDLQPGQVSRPPQLHWAFVGLLSLVTLGWFASFWLFIQTKWVRSVRGHTRAYGWAMAYLVYSSISTFANVVQLIALHTLSRNWNDGYTAGSLATLALVPAFALQEELEEPPFSLRYLSGWMIFFFGTVYLQFNLQGFEVEPLEAEPLKI